MAIIPRKPKNLKVLHLLIELGFQISRRRHDEFLFLMTGIIGIYIVFRLTLSAGKLPN